VGVGRAKPAPGA